MRKMVKIKFLNPYSGFRPQESAVYRAIAVNYDIELSEEPEYVIVLPYGHEHLNKRYDSCVHIFFTGENQTPDFNLSDYAIGFDHLTLGDRYVRVPLWAIRSNFAHFRQAQRPSDEQLLNRDFCSFVVSNWRGDSFRTQFFHELSKYKKVNSGGYHLNNVGGPVKDKLAFVAKHKFNIAFENSEYPGYTTEKIMDPLSVWSVPIYWGDPLVDKDFHPQSFIRLKTKDDIERAIEEIIRLDSDDGAYLEKCKAPCLFHPEIDYYLRQMELFFKHIFEQPHAMARRVSSLGYQGVFYRPRLQRAFARYDFWERPLNLARKVKRFIKCW